MNKRTLLIAIVALVGLCTPNKGYAAATVEDIDWSSYAKTVSDVANTGTFVYLYNTQTKKFLTSGGIYGMQGIFASVGMRFLIESGSTSGTYKIHSRFSNPAQGEYLSIVNTNEVYLDRLGSVDKTNKVSYPQWRFVARANGTYALRNNDFTTKSSYGRTTYYYWLLYNSTLNIISPTSSTNTTSVPTNGYQWIIVTEADYRSEIAKLNATYINVSGLIYDTRFDRKSSDKSFWTTTGSAAINDEWTEAEEGDLGAFNAASIKEVEDEGETTGGKLSQTITGLSKGLYRICCQSFNVIENSNDNCAYLFATPKYGDVTGSTEQVLLNSITSSVFNGNVPESATTASSDAIKAGAIFANGDMYNTGEENASFTNELFIMITEDDASLEFGVYKDCNIGNVFADNFELFYCGTQQMFLDANNTSTEARTVTDGAATGIDYTEYKYPVRLNLRRSFTLNKWNAIVLPVDLSGDQVKAAFGNGDAKLSKLVGINPDRPSQILFQSVDLDREGLNKGECYIVYVTKGPDLEKGATESYLNKNTENVTIKGPVYHIEGVTQDAYSNASVTKEYSTSAGLLTFTGYYYRPESVNAGLYMMEYGNMYHLTAAYTSLFGTYWTLSYSDGSTSDSKFSLAIDGVDEGTTAIEGINIGRTEAAGQDGIYTIGGQRMSQEDMKLLPKGIYIVKGKKIVVR